MTNEELLREFNTLPSEVKSQIERIIERFKKDQTTEARPKKKIPLREEPFFGMWKDREDMKDGGAAWVRKIREEQWNKHRR